MKHLTDDELSAYLDGAARGREAETLSQHLAECPPCREALAAMAAQDQALKPALTHDPGEAYFESFAARVEGRLRAADLTGAGARSDGFDLGRLFRSPRALAWSGALAVVVVGGGLALMISREVSLPPLVRERDVAQRIDGAPAAPAPAQPDVPAGADKEEAARLAERERGSAPGAPGAKDADARARGGRTGEIALEPTDERATAGAPAPAIPRDMSPSRAYEVQRTESGEETAKRPPVAAAPPSAPTAGAANENKVTRRAQAAPLRKDEAPRAQEAQPGAVSGGARHEDVQPRAKSAAGAPKMLDSAAPAGAEVKVCGDVRDSEGRPIPGAQVTVSDLGRGVAADPQGHFCVSLPRGEHELSIMAVGYAPSRRYVRVQGGDPDVQVMLAVVPVMEESRVMAQKRIDTPSYSSTTRMIEAPLGALDAVALPDSVLRVMREADRLEKDAASRRSAPQYDAAANAWERSQRMLPPTASPNLELDVRRRLATARYRAWELQPDDRRARAAAEALSAYVSRAPAGPQRTEAQAWLDRVRH